MKPNCYECRWRGDLSGDAHSCCRHPSAAVAANDPLGKILAMFASVGRIAPIGLEETPLNIRGSAHGIRMGWFNWPWNFDPVWLESCNGFERKEVKHDAQTTGQ